MWFKQPFPPLHLQLSPFSHFPYHVRNIPSFLKFPKHGMLHLIYEPSGFPPLFIQADTQP